MKTLNYSLLSCFLLILLSCDNGEEITNRKLVTVRLPENLFEDNTTVYVMASDKDGKTLDYQQISSGETVTLESNNFRQQTFTFSYVSIDDKDLFGNSFHEVPVGISIIHDEVVYHSYAVKSTNYDASANSYNISIFGGYGSFYVNNEEKIIVGTSQESPVFLTKNYIDENTGVSYPSGYHYMANEVIHANQPLHEIELGVNFTPFETETIQINSSSFFGGNNVVFGIIDNDLKKSLVLSYNEFYVGELIINHTGDLFDRYASYNALFASDYIYYSFNNLAKYDFEIPTFTIHDVNVSGQAVVANVTAPEALLSYWFSYFDNNGYKDWIMTTPSDQPNKTYSIPNIPTEITNQLNGFSLNQFEWEEDLFVSTIGGESNITDFIIFQLQPFDVDVPNHNYKEVRKFFNDADIREKRNLFDKNKARPKNKLSVIKAISNKNHFNYEK